MNCKQGDLAVVVKSAGNGRSIGKIVECIRFKPGQMFVDGTRSDAWVVSPALPALHGGLTDTVRDEFLRPIRDPGEDARDQSLDWLPVPHKETA